MAFITNFHSLSPNLFFPFHVYWAEISGSKAPDFISPNSRAPTVPGSLACTLEWVLPHVLPLLEVPYYSTSLGMEEAQGGIEANAILIIEATTFLLYGK